MEFAHVVDDVMCLCVVCVCVCVCVCMWEREREGEGLTDWLNVCSYKDETAKPRLKRLWRSDALSLCRRVDTRRICSRVGALSKENVDLAWVLFSAWTQKQWNRCSETVEVSSGGRVERFCLFVERIKQNIPEL